MASILDTIDNAVADCGISTDAMRWTPDPTPQPTPNPPLLGALELAEALDYSLTEWQRHMLERQARLAREMADVVRIQMAVIADRCAAAARGLGTAHRAILDEMRWHQPRRPARVTKMRQDYRAKRGRRW